MMFEKCHRIALLSAALAGAASLALIAGCKGSTSAAASLEHPVPPPPVVQALPLSADGLGRNTVMDPLADGCWSNARWMPLVSPANTHRTTTPVSAAILYDAKCLYVAFIANNPRGGVVGDAVSVYLDSSSAGTGADMIEVTVPRHGQARCTWIRDSEPPLKARDDGSPDIYHPVSRIPDVPIGGLAAKAAEGEQNGLPVWTVVVGIPLKNLPTPLRAAPVMGNRWKLNLLRTTMMPDNGNGPELLQSNLSPVFVAAQAVAPYRMADLELAKPTTSTVLLSQ